MARAVTIGRIWRKFKVRIGGALYRFGLIRRATIFRWEVEQCIGPLLLVCLLAIPSIGTAGHCRQFFVQKQFAYVAPVQVVYPAVAVSPYLYRAGQDIEADSLAAKVARLVVPQIIQQLQAPQALQQQAPGVLAQRCAKCHSGANPKAGLVLDGASPLTSSQITACIREVKEDVMPKGGPHLTPEQKGALLEELLSLEAERQPDLAPLQQPADRPPPPEQVPPPAPTGELK